MTKAKLEAQKTTAVKATKKRRSPRLVENVYRKVQIKAEGNPKKSEKNVPTSTELPWHYGFSKDDAKYINYMNNEWSFEIRNDDRALFEKLCLEGAQAGLTWKQILDRREAYCEVFHEFDVEKVSKMTSSDIDEIMQSEGTEKRKTVIKHRDKLESVIHNAKQLLTMAKRDESFTTFSDYLWSFVDDKPILNHWKKFEDLPSQTVESKKMSQGLKAHGFKFVGPTICYAFMQSCGFVIDHPVNTPEWKAAFKRLKTRLGGFQCRGI